MTGSVLTGQGGEVLLTTGSILSVQGSEVLLTRGSVLSVSLTQTQECRSFWGSKNVTKT